MDKLIVTYDEQSAVISLPINGQETFEFVADFEAGHDKNSDIKSVVVGMFEIILEAEASQNKTHVSFSRTENRPQNDRLTQSYYLNLPEYSADPKSAQIHERQLINKGEKIIFGNCRGVKAINMWLHEIENHNPKNPVTC